MDAMTMATLAERRDQLRGRLEVGYDRIEAAERAGADVTEWEALWFRLLHEYEQVCRDLDGISRQHVEATPCTEGYPMQRIEPATQPRLGGIR